MIWAALRLAITLLTAVPLPGSHRVDKPSRTMAAAAMCWAPVVGVVLGGVAAGVLVLAARIGHLGPLLAAVLAIAALAGLTRGLHLDGLADLADGLGSRRPAAQALQIMKRSDIGPYGVLTLVLTLLLQVSALARAEQLGRGPAGLVAAVVAGRLAITLACRRGVRSARPGGLGALVAGSVHPAIAALLAVVALGTAGLAGWRYPVAMATGLAVSLVLTGLAERRLGGITGDVLGALAEISTAVALLALAVS
ncbi:MAG TPA: adenosylcobinamide-GDP ribazoletransferase [Streptosporangiaceae bacterium]